MRYLVLVLKGMAYGITHIVPGLGGGLMLILLGIYEPFVDAVGNVFLRRDRWREYIPFLGSLAVGAVVAMLAFARLMSALLASHEAPTMLFFMGLMLGTIPAVAKIHPDMRPRPGRIAALLVGIALVVGVRGLERLEVHGSVEGGIQGVGGLAYSTVTAFAAGCASVTPGLDGSYVFLLAGTYEPIMRALSALIRLEVRWAILVTTTMGAALGIVLWAKAVDTIIKRAPAVAYYGVLGLIVGSLYGLWPDTAPSDSVVVMVLAFGVGLGLALYFGRPEGEGVRLDPGAPVEEAGLGARPPTRWRPWSR